MLCEGLRQGDAPASVYFNVRNAKAYMKEIETLVGSGVLFAVSDDVAILAPPAIIA